MSSPEEKARLCAKQAQILFDTWCDHPNPDLRFEIGLLPYYHVWVSEPHRAVSIVCATKGTAVFMIEPTYLCPLKVACQVRCILKQYQ